MCSHAVHVFTHKLTHIKPLEDDAFESIVWSQVLVPTSARRFLRASESSNANAFRDAVVSDARTFVVAVLVCDQDGKEDMLLWL